MYFRCLSLRYFSGTSGTLCSRATTGFSLKPRPFEEIPGPKSLPFIGTLYKYFPYLGKNCLFVVIEIFN